MTSAAITVLVAEIVTLETDHGELIAKEDAARQKSTVARQTLDARVLDRQASGERLEATRTALAIIRKRDEASEATVETLLDAERARR